MSGNRDSDVEVRFGANIDNALEGIRDVTTNLQGIGGVVQELIGIMPELAAALGAAFVVDKVEALTEKMAELGLETKSLSEQLGLSTAEVSDFSYAAGSVGVSTQAAAMALERMSRGLDMTSKAGSPAQQAMAALGIQFKAADGSILPLAQLLPDIADKFKSFADGPNKTALAMELLGRSGARMIPILDQGRQGLDALTAAARAAGVELDPDTADAMLATHEAMYKLDGEIQGVSIAAFTALQPLIIDTVNAMTDLVPKLKDAATSSAAWDEAWAPLLNSFTSAANELRDLNDEISKLNVTINGQNIFVAGAKVEWDYFIQTVQAATFVFDIVIHGFQMLIEEIRYWAEQVQIFAVAVTQTLKDVAGGDSMEEITSNWEANMQKMEDATRKHFENMQWIAENTAANIAAIGNKFNANDPNLQVSSPGQGAYNEQADALAVKPPAPKPHPLNEGDAGAKKALQERVQEFLQGEATIRASAAETSNFQKQMDQLDLASAKDVLQQELDAGIITKTEYYARLTQLQNQDTQKQVAAIHAQIDLLTQQGTAEVNNKDLTLKQKQALEEQYALAVQKLYDQILILQKKNDNDALNNTRLSLKAQEDEYTKFYTQITTKMGDMFKSFLSGSLTWKSALGQILDGIVSNFVNMAEKMVVKWLVSEELKTAATVAGNAARLTDTVVTEQAGKTVEREGNLDSIISSAYTAAAATYKSIAAIPIIGPVLAPVAAAAAFVAVAAFGGDLPSAAGGMEVDKDQIVKVHEKEMILPVPLAAGISNMIKNAPSAGSIQQNAAGPSAAPTNAAAPFLTPSLVTPPPGLAAPATPNVSAAAPAPVVNINVPAAPTPVPAPAPSATGQVVPQPQFITAPPALVPPAPPAPAPASNVIPFPAPAGTPPAPTPASAPSPFVPAPPALAAPVAPTAPVAATAPAAGQAPVAPAAGQAPIAPVAPTAGQAAVAPVAPSTPLPAPTPYVQPPAAVVNFAPTQPTQQQAPAVFSPGVDVTRLQQPQANTIGSVQTVTNNAHEIANDNSAAQKAAVNAPAPSENHIHLHGPFVQALDTQTGAQFIDKNIGTFAKKLSQHLDLNPSARPKY